MLVLSRRPQEKIVFPNLGISVQICSIAGNTVRLGVEAPRSVSVVREELLSESDRQSQAKPELESSKELLDRAKSTAHRFRNRMNTANLAIHLAQKQLQAGLLTEAQRTLDEALQQYRELDEELATAKKPAPSKRPIRALLVEDNRNESALLAEFLRLHGVKVETACDGQEALDYLQSHDRPDVILLDMRMPRVDGATTIAAIRGNSQYDGLKVFAVSGSDPQDCHVPEGARGVDGWFRKPLDPIHLVDEMKLALGQN